MPKVGHVPFKFFDIWTSHAHLLDTVKEVWKRPVLGTKMFQGSKKLESLQQPFRTLNKDQFGDVRVKLAIAKDKVSKMQLDIQQLPTNRDLYNV